MNIAHNLGLWLSLIRSIEGLGAEVAFQVVNWHREPRSDWKIRRLRQFARRQEEWDYCQYCGQGYAVGE
jgi:hypothetical protein